MKKIIAILLMMVILNMLVVGCVSRQNYDALMVEYDGLRALVESVQNEIQTLQSDLAAEQSKTVRLESDLAEAQAKNLGLTSRLEKAESELQAGSAELTASVQKSQAELEAAQIKVSELTSSLEKVENELETIKSEYEAFKSEVESLLLLSLDQHLALKEASRDVQSASITGNVARFISVVTTVEDMLADLNGEKAGWLRSHWNDAYYIERVKVPNPTFQEYRCEYRWGLNYRFFGSFNRLNDEIILTLRTLLRVY